MNLVAEMVKQYLEVHHSKDVSVSQMRPAMRRRLARCPIPGIKQFAYNADRLVNRFVDYPRFLRGKTWAFDLFHVVDHSYSHLLHTLPAARTLVTCHDLDTFRCLLDPQREPRPAWFRALTQRILDGFLKAAHVVSVSGAVREELTGRRLFSPDRVTVISNGVHPSCSPIPDPAADAEASVLLRSTAENVIYLLNVGIPIPRKRIDLLLRVFAAVRNHFPAVRLVRVGGAFTGSQAQLARQLGIQDDIIILPFLTRPVLAAVYRRSDLLLQCSEAEGFGLPLVEAMACGCPVISSDIPALRETGGTAATYCEPGDAGAWTSTVIDLLRQRETSASACEDRRQKALSHASHFSWQANARQTVEVYRKVLHSQ